MCWANPSTLLEFHREPGSGVGPPGICGPGRDAEDFGGLGERQAAEVPQLDEFRKPGLFNREPGQRLVEGLDPTVVRRDGQVIRLHLDPPPTTAFGGVPGSGLIDQDPSHGLGGGHQVVAPGRERPLAAELQERLVNQRRGVERLPRPLQCQLRRRELAEFVVNLGQDLGGVHFKTLENDVAFMDSLDQAASLEHRPWRRSVARFRDNRV